MGGGARWRRETEGNLASSMPVQHFAIKKMFLGVADSEEVPNQRAVHATDRVQDDDPAGSDFRAVQESASLRELRRAAEP